MTCPFSHAPHPVCCLPPLCIVVATATTFEALCRRPPLTSARSDDASSTITPLCFFGRLFSGDVPDAAIDAAAYTSRALWVRAPREAPIDSIADAMANTLPVSTDLDAYDEYIERMREHEYPMLKDAVYLDHAGTTLYSKTLMDRFHHDMMANLYGNPHSASLSSQRSTLEVEDVRIRLLQFFHADPEHFDFVFTANATAAIKLVGEAFRELENGFWYGYHVDAHTSLVGLRELAKDHTCFESDQEVEEWLSCTLSEEPALQPRLFAYPAQSNMNGRRLPLDWSRRLRTDSGTYTLLDAAALVSTAPLNLSDPDSAPDFTALSLYKIFGFPDIGALIVRKGAAHIFDRRRYFGGGTVDMVACVKEQWHAKKSGPLHERLEDGTLPTHSIVAVKSALQTHQELFSSLDQISRHTSNLAQQLYDGLSLLRHANGQHVCTIHQHAHSDYRDTRTQGPTIAMNLKDSQGRWVSNTEVEKLAGVKNIHLRTGGVCNPGGVANALDLKPWELQENFSAGHRCGGENDILNGKPTGIIRLSLGATSTLSDVRRFLAFMREFFVDTEPTGLPPPSSNEQRFYIESLAVYPIKSCGGYQVPHGKSWEVRSHGLAWDREWCILHKGTGKALSQKQNPRMALIKPTLDFKDGLLHIAVIGSTEKVIVPLSKDPALFTAGSGSMASVCGDTVEALVYSSAGISDFLSKVVGVPCVLARYNPAASFSRHCKPHLQRHGRSMTAAQPIYMANESPILTISRSSLNRLNEQIKLKGGKAAHPSVFRANIVLAEDLLLNPGSEQPWAEDQWGGMRVGGLEGPEFGFLGGCRRCQMVCVDQCSAEKNPEPFVTLAKTRRFDGRVLFGVHTALQGARPCLIKAGNAVETFGGGG